jgi:hypothetical protein
MLQGTLHRPTSVDVQFCCMPYLPARIPAAKSAMMQLLLESLPAVGGVVIIIALPVTQRHLAFI